MNGAPSWSRRLAMKLAQHASWVLCGAGPWADAMRHELDYIADDRPPYAGRSEDSWRATGRGSPNCDASAGGPR
jgi:hypothetical protein